MRNRGHYDLCIESMSPCEHIGIQQFPYAMILEPINLVGVIWFSWTPSQTFLHIVHINILIAHRVIHDPSLLIGYQMIFSTLFHCFSCFLASILNIQLCSTNDFTLLLDVDINTSASFKGPARADFLPPASLFRGPFDGGQTAPCVLDLGHRRRALHLSAAETVRRISAHVQQPSPLNIDMYSTVREQQVQTINIISTGKYHPVRSIP